MNYKQHGTLKARTKSEVDICSTDHRVIDHGCADIGWREQEEMIKPESPCLDCIERQFNCHSGCKEYKEFTEINEKYKELLRQGRKSEFMEYLVERRRKDDN